MSVITRWRKIKDILFGRKKAVNSRKGYWRQYHLRKMATDTAYVETRRKRARLYHQKLRSRK